ncbi:MAG: Membrane protein containing transrane [Candidatus Saccharibacteria bacterium]|nr:Membrane protein containing transrane [Candidatus Saccharibacteria bacterium]
MTGRTHDAAAFVALSVVALSQPLVPVTLPTLLLALLANQIGGIAPDIDQPTAPFWRNLPVGRVFGRAFGLLSGGHRFITHSLLGLALAGVAVDALLHALHPIMPNVNLGYVWWSFMIGMLSHLVMDSITREGVPWLLPIPIKFGFPPVKRLRVVTGKKFEIFIIFPGIILIGALFYATHYAAAVHFLHHSVV